MIDLAPEHLETVRRIAAAHFPDTRILVFGSRAQGTARPYSDLDIAVIEDGPLPVSRIEAAKDAFSASDLPISVDIVDYNAVTPAFRAVIDASGLSLF